MLNRNVCLLALFLAASQLSSQSFLLVHNAYIDHLQLNQLSNRRQFAEVSLVTRSNSCSSFIVSFGCDRVVILCCVPPNITFADVFLYVITERNGVLLLRTTKRRLRRLARTS
jgi:hypothetical protein